MNPKRNLYLLKKTNMKTTTLKQYFGAMTWMAILLTGMITRAEPNINASDPGERGLAIAIAADKRDTGWKDWGAEAVMTLKNKHGQSSSRKMQLKALEQASEGDKRIIYFETPRDVKGTAFLVYTKKKGSDDQWLYLPALKRVKRIASKNQSGPFVGSEFAYEDLSSQEVEKYTYKHLRDESYQGQMCHVVERYPTDKASGYSRQIVWMDTKEYRQLKVDYYDRKNSLLKTLVSDGFKSYGKGFWRADRFYMENHQTGKTTELVWSNYLFTQGLKDREFHSTKLRNF